MAHELEFQQGTASMFSVGQTPWHGEGTVLAAAPNYAEAMKLARLDYEVEKVQLFRRVAEDEFVPSMGHVTYRADTGRELGTVGKDYAIVQNRDAFAVLEPLVDRGVAALETGGVLRNGADAWMLVRWDVTKFGPLVREVFADEVVPFGLLSTNHTGRRGVLLKDTPIRVVCANTLGTAEGLAGHSVSVRHRGDATSRMVDAAQQMWGGIIERMDGAAQAYRALKGKFLDEAMFRRLVVDVVARDPRLVAKADGARVPDHVMDRYFAKVNTVTHLWEHGKGHVGDHSAWEAYNGAVEALDHEVALFPSRDRVASLLDGDLAKRKAQVFTNLLSA